MKKHISCLLFIIIALFLAACNHNDTQENQTLSNYTEKPITTSPIATALSSNNNEKEITTQTEIYIENIETDYPFAMVLEKYLKQYYTAKYLTNKLPVFTNIFCENESTNTYIKWAEFTIEREDISYSPTDELTIEIVCDEQIIIKKIYTQHFEYDKQNISIQAEIQEITKSNNGIECTLQLNMKCSQRGEGQQLYILFVNENDNYLIEEIDLPDSNDYTEFKYNNQET